MHACCFTVMRCWWDRWYLFEVWCSAWGSGSSYWNVGEALPECTARICLSAWRQRQTWIWRRLKRSSVEDGEPTMSLSCLIDLPRSTTPGQELTTKHWQQKQHIWITEIFLIRMLYKDCYWSTEHLTSLILNLYIYIYVCIVQYFVIQFTCFSATLFGLRYNNLILNENMMQYDTIRLSQHDYDNK